MSLDRLVNVVCHRLLNQPLEERQTRVLDPVKERKPFTLLDYEFDSHPWHVAKFLIARGIGKSTQEAFEPYMKISYKKREDGKQYGNLSFPLTIPGNKTVVGMELRGFPNKEGKSSFKGMAAGSNSAEGLWIAYPGHEELPPMDQVTGVAWFESAYDAMAFYQFNERAFDEHPGLAENALYVSTGGTPTDGQMRNMLKVTPEAHHFLCFDNDKAGREFCAHFHRYAESMGIPKENVMDFPLLPCYKDWNDALQDKRTYTGDEVIPLTPKKGTEQDVDQQGGLKR